MKKKVVSLRTVHWNVPKNSSSLWKHPLFLRGWQKKASSIIKVLNERGATDWQVLLQQVLNIPMIQLPYNRAPSVTVQMWCSPLRPSSFASSGSVWLCWDTLGFCCVCRILRCPSLSLFLSGRCDLTFSGRGTQTSPNTLVPFHTPRSWAALNNLPFTPTFKHTHTVQEYPWAHVNDQNQTSQTHEDY